MWDQKNGKYPWKPGTPIFKCRDKECATKGGVYWEDRGPSIKPAIPLQQKPERPTTRSAPSAHSASNRPQDELPEFLRDQESQDAKELSAKIEEAVNFDAGKLRRDIALYQAITEYVLRDIAPIYERAKIGMSPESAAAATATLFIQAKR